ncbi:MAG: DEAD/DEAH box helicase [Thermoplasmata archaeon]
MTVLHAVIDRTERRNSHAGIHLWGETSESTERRNRDLRQSRGRAPVHPFALSARELRPLLVELGEGTTLGPPPEGVSTLIRIRIPSRGSMPVFSWEEPGRSGAELSTWTVPTVFFELGEAMPWLAKLPVNELPLDAPRIGPGLRYAAQLAKFSLDLLARHRFVPSVGRDRTGAIRAEWRAFLFNPEELETAAVLHRSLPPSFWALAAEGSGPEQPPRVRDLLDASVDALARHWLAEEPPAPVVASEPLERRWLRSLTSGQPTFVAGRTSAGLEFVRGFEHWTTGLWQTSEAEGSLGFRACFRIDPPRARPEDEVQTLAETPAGTWRLRVFLQARDEPSVLFPASRLFDAAEGYLERRGRVVVHPQEVLLAELGRAARLCPMLRPLLEAPRPEGLALSLEEAYRFLRDSAPELTECGFGVRTPPWWGLAEHKLTARMKVEPPPAGGGLFGLQGLLQYDLQIAIGDAELTAEDLERMASLKVPLVRWRGQWVELRPEEVRAALRALKRARTGGVTVAEALTAAAEGTFDEIPLSDFRAEGPLRALLEAGHAESLVEAVPSPAGLVGQLRPYQLRGVAWAACLRRLGLGGCLADDMGLGKTVQTLALRLHVRSEPKAPWLLVAPTSVVSNWWREAQRFAPDLQVLVHHGADRLKGSRFVRSVARSDLVLTSYALLWRDEALLKQVMWDTVVLDEAQGIKNPLSKAARAARSLRARHRLALTGTPVENRLTELWSLFEFLNPGYLGPITSFRENFANRIERFGDEGIARQLQRLVRPMILRRVKSDPTIAPDLPAKVEQKVFCPLTPEQATLYEATVRDMLERIEQASGMERRGLVLSALTKLKQVCDHPALLLHDRSAVPGRSGKLERLVEMLSEAFEEGDRALVFTQYAEMGEMLREHLTRTFQVDVPFLHGGLPTKERDLLIRRFQDDHGPPVFVLSLKAGGFGLNLTRANRVFHFDRWWNPAVEDQATDRAHRIGQPSRVMVHKFVSDGTLEERIEQLLEQKRGLAGRILTQGEAGLTELSTTDLRELFALRRETIFTDFSATSSSRTSPDPAVEAG